jgi:hypothetical protein
MPHGDFRAARQHRAATLGAVRRIIFIVLLAILPVQFSWAAASAYCHHESGAGAKHFGHHEHQHKAGADGASQDKKVASSGQADNDCGSCQFSAAQPIPAAAADLPVQSAGPQCLASTATYGSHIPSGPERPDRDASTPAVRFGGAVMIGASLPA